MADGIMGLLDPSQAPGQDPNSSPFDNRVVLTSALAGLAAGFNQANQPSRLPVSASQVIGMASQGALSGYQQGIGALYNSQLANAKIQSDQADAMQKHIAAAKALQQYQFSQNILNGGNVGQSAPGSAPQQGPQGAVQGQPAPQGIPAAPQGGMPPAGVDPSQGAAPQPGQGPVPQMPMGAPGPAPQLQPMPQGQQVPPVANGVAPDAIISSIIRGNIHTWDPQLLGQAVLKGSIAGLDVSGLQDQLKHINTLADSGKTITDGPDGRPIVSAIPGFNQATMGTSQATALGTSLGTNQQTIGPDGSIAALPGSLQQKAAGSLAGAAGTLANTRLEGQNTQAAQLQAAALRPSTPTLTYDPNTGATQTIDTAHNQPVPAGYQVASQSTPGQAAIADANKSVITQAPETVQTLRQTAATIGAAKAAVSDPSFQAGGIQALTQPVRQILSNYLGPQAAQNLNDQQALAQSKGLLAIGLTKSALGGSGRVDQSEFKAVADSSSGLENTPQSIKSRIAQLESLNQHDQDYYQGKLSAVSSGQSATDYDNQYFASHPAGIYTPQDSAAFKIIQTPVKPGTTPSFALPKFQSPQDYQAWYQQYHPYFDANQNAGVIAAYNKAKFNNTLYTGN